METCRIHIPAFLLFILLGSVNVYSNTVDTTYRPRTFALIIGISNYKEVSLQLDYASDDAKHFYQYLKDYEGVSDSTIQMLIDEKANFLNIENSLDDLHERIHPGDRFFFFFAGHGDAITKYGTSIPLLLLFNISKTNYINNKEIGYYRIDDLKDRMDSLSAKKIEIIMIVDACRAGRLIGGEQGRQLTASALADSWPNLLKILSCQPNQRSYEGTEWGAGVFTYHLLEGLQGLADTSPKDSVVSVKEIAHYLQNEVSKQVEQMPVIVGDYDKILVKVNTDSLSRLIDRKKQQFKTLFTVLPKGQLEELKTRLSQPTLMLYESFLDALREHRLISPQKDCAYQYYLELLVTDFPADFRHILKRDFTSALIEHSNILEFNFEKYSSFVSANLSNLLSGFQKIHPGLPIDKGDTLLISLGEHVDELKLASKLLGSNHYLSPNIEARRLFWEACIDIGKLLLSSETTNKSGCNEGISIFNKFKPAQEKLKLSLQNEPNVYVELMLMGIDLIYGNYEESEKFALDLKSKLPNDDLVALALGIIETIQYKPINAEIHLLDAIKLTSKNWIKTISYICLVAVYKQSSNNAKINFYINAFWNSIGQLNSKKPIISLIEESSDLFTALKYIILMDSFDEDVPLFHKRKYQQYCQLALSRHPRSNKYKNTLPFWMINEYDMAYKYIQKDSLSQPILFFKELETLYTNTQQIDKAIFCQQKLIDLFKDSIQNYDYTKIAYLYDRIKMEKVARNYYKMRLDQCPRDNLALSNLGFSYFMKKKYDSSAVFYRRAIEIDSANSLNSYIGLIDLYKEQGKFEEAFNIGWIAVRKSSAFWKRQHIKILIDLYIDQKLENTSDPNKIVSEIGNYIDKFPSANLYLKLSKLYEILDGTFSAKHIKEKGAQRLQSSPLYFSLADDAMENKEYLEATHYIQQAINKDSSNASAYVMYANLLLHHSNLQSLLARNKAISICFLALNQVFLTNPQEIFKELFLINKSSNNVDLNNQITYLINKYPNYLQPIFETLIDVVNEDNYQLAIKLMEKKRHKSSDICLLTQYIARLYFYYNNYEKAAYYFQEALRYKPLISEQENIYRHLALSLIELGTFEKRFLELIKHKPEHKKIISYELADYYSKNNNHEKAIKYYSLSLLGFSSSPKIVYRQLAYHYDKIGNINSCVIFIEKAYLSGGMIMDLTSYGRDYSTRIPNRICSSQPYKEFISKYEIDISALCPVEQH